MPQDASAGPNTTNINSDRLALVFPLCKTKHRKNHIITHQLIALNSSQIAIAKMPNATIGPRYGKFVLWAAIDVIAGAVGYKDATAPDVASAKSAAATCVNYGDLNPAMDDFHVELSLLIESVVKGADQQPSWEDIKTATADIHDEQKVFMARSNAAASAAYAEKAAAGGAKDAAAAAAEAAKALREAEAAQAKTKADRAAAAAK